jgi:hypothetical protein
MLREADRRSLRESSKSNGLQRIDVFCSSTPGTLNEEQGTDWRFLNELKKELKG